jgi:Peptidase of plants and bacteria
MIELNRKTGAALLTGISILMLFAMAATAEVRITIEQNDNDHASSAFKFQHVPQPSKNDAGSAAKFSVIDGEADAGSGGISMLNDGAVPMEEDDPSANFFFAPGTDGGRVLADLGNVIDLKQVSSYSWHPGSRGPQVYQLYASDGTFNKFDSKPEKGKDLATCGWKLLAKVDTRKQSKGTGGQYGVCISETGGSLGKFRYLLFDISRTEEDDDFGNTFYSEIDIVGKDDPAPIPVAADMSSNSFTLRSADGHCEISIQLVGAEGLQAWAKEQLAPALAEWYPKIAAMLPSDGYIPPSHMSLIVKPGRGVAATGGTRITANASWLKGEIGRQAVGSLIHEEVHVIQQYGRGRRNNPNATSNPGWLVEGIADYIRFYQFEPQTHGAEISRRGLERAKYDGSYRVTANFLNWVTENHDPEIVRKLNAAMREGKYSDDIWKSETGKTLQELGKDWKASLEKKLETSTRAAIPTS